MLRFFILRLRFADVCNLINDYIIIELLFFHYVIISFIGFEGTKNIKFEKVILSEFHS